MTWWQKITFRLGIASRETINVAIAEGLERLRKKGLVVEDPPGSNKWRRK